MDIKPLFEMPDEIQSEQKTCRNCIHRQRWQCNSKVISYCECWKSKRTENGLKKVKCTDKACYLYKEDKS